MFRDYWKSYWVLAAHRDNGREGLRTCLADKVITAAEAKVREREKRRRKIEEELTKQ